MDFSGHAQEYFPTNRGSLSTISLSPNFTTRLLPRLMVFRDTTGIITASMPTWQKNMTSCCVFLRFPRCCFFQKRTGWVILHMKRPNNMVGYFWSQSSYCWWLRNPVNQRKDVLKNSGINCLQFSCCKQHGFLKHQQVWNLQEPSVFVIVRLQDKN